MTAAAPEPSPSATFLANALRDAMAPDFVVDTAPSWLSWRRDFTILALITVETEKGAAAESETLEDVARAQARLAAIGVMMAAATDIRRIP